MPKAICGNLLEKPDLCLDQMAIFLWGEFDVHATKSSISRAHASKCWSKNATRQEAGERNLGLLF
jgi:hypothetical protein